MMRADSGRRGGSVMRLAGLVHKEFLQIVRDPSSIAIAFVMPLFLLVLFGYGVSLDADHVPVALVDEAPSVDSTDFLAFKNCYSGANVPWSQSLTPSCAP